VKKTKLAMIGLVLGIIGLFFAILSLII